MLTEADELKLAGEAAYYWRARAVDAAENEGAWTTASDFLAGGGAASGLPTWAIIVIGVGGGLFLLLAGFWLGRRTAFYY
jgi:hypothetical protein